MAGAQLTGRAAPLTPRGPAAEPGGDGAARARALLPLLRVGRLLVPRVPERGARPPRARCATALAGLRGARLGAQVTHGVLLVGMGETDDTPPQKYWTLKNSWSEFWGEDGYMRIAREPAEMCGVGSEAYFPVLAQHIT